MKKVILFIFALSFCISLRAQTLDDLLSSANLLEKQVNSALNEAGNVLSDQQRSLLINLMNYTAYVTGMLRELAGEVDRSLTQKELAILNDINTISRSGLNFYSAPAPS